MNEFQLAKDKRDENVRKAGSALNTLEELIDKIDRLYEGNLKANLNHHASEAQDLLLDYLDETSVIKSYCSGTEE